MCMLLGIKHISLTETSQANIMVDDGGNAQLRILAFPQLSRSKRS